MLRPHRPIRVIRSSIWVKSKRAAGRKVRSLHAFSLSLSSLWYYRFRPYGVLLAAATAAAAAAAATAAARQPFTYMLPAIWQTAWRKRRLQRRRYNAHVSLIRHETSRRVFERHYNDRGRRREAKQGEGCEYWPRPKEIWTLYIFSIQGVPKIKHNAN